MDLCTTVSRRPWSMDHKMCVNVGVCSWLIHLWHHFCSSRWLHKEGRMQKQDPRSADLFAFAFRCRLTENEKAGTKHASAIPERRTEEPGTAYQLPETERWWQSVPQIFFIIIRMIAKMMMRVCTAAAVRGSRLLVTAWKSWDSNDRLLLLIHLLQLTVASVEIMRLMMKGRWIALRQLNNCSCLLFALFLFIPITIPTAADQWSVKSVLLPHDEASARVQHVWKLFVQTDVRLSLLSDSRSPHSTRVCPAGSS